MTMLMSQVEDLFALSTYPKITHLCIPAYFLDGAGKRNKVPSTAQSDRDIPFDWAHFSQIFPSVTHLYPFHPDIPVNTVANIAPNTLQKLALNLGGSPVPIDFITGIVHSQTASLKSVHLGHAEGQRGPGRGFEELGMAFKKCTKMEDFRWACEGKSSQDMQRYAVEAYGEAMGGPWQSTLKVSAMTSRTLDSPSETIADAVASAHLPFPEILPQCPHRALGGRRGRGELLRAASRIPLTSRRKHRRYAPACPVYSEVPESP
jgi:hypothetical protein